jgi:hypothetical protein
VVPLTAGSSVATWTDSSREYVLIGSPWYQTPIAAGGAWLYERTIGSTSFTSYPLHNWRRAANDERSSDRFGESVAIRGGYAFVGAPGMRAVYPFRLPFSQQAPGFGDTLNRVIDVTITDFGQSVDYDTVSNTLVSCGTSTCNYYGIFLDGGGQPMGVSQHSGVSAARAMVFAGSSGINVATVTSAPGQGGDLRFFNRTEASSSTFPSFGGVWGGLATFGNRSLIAGNGSAFVRVFNWSGGSVTQGGTTIAVRSAMSLWAWA